MILNEERRPEWGADLLNLEFHFSGAVSAKPELSRPSSLEIFLSSADLNDLRNIHIMRHIFCIIDVH